MKVVLSILFSVLVLSGVSFAAPTAEQLAAFSSLSSDQQAALIQKYNAGNLTAVRDAPLSAPVIATKKTANSKMTEIEREVNKATDVPVTTEQAEVLKVDGGLKQFGYDLFSTVPTTFAPVTDIPVPVDYRIGPGDEVKVKLYGKESLDYSLVVSREGVLNFPGVGEVHVVGLGFSELKDELKARINKQFIGMQSSITMGSLRSIRIYVMGNVNRSGSFTVSSLSTLTNALFVSGGVSSIGTLRDIQLKRNGEIITHFDLYSLLMEGDTSSDVRLQPGDVIFVPAIGKTVGIAGEVLRPAIYELKGKENISDVIEFSGGFIPTAYPQLSQIERINEQGERGVLNVDLSKKTANDRLLAGDTIRIYSVLDSLEDVVLLEGHVERPGGYQWREGMTISDLISSPELLLPRGDLNYALVRRELQPNREIEVHKVSLKDIFSNTKNDFTLQAKDRVMVFGLQGKRQGGIAPLVNQLNQQADYESPSKVVSITGNVRNPGSYPLTKSMRVSDLLQAAVDVLPETDEQYALLRREYGTERRVDVEMISLADVLSGNTGVADVLLQPRDKLVVFNVNENRVGKIEPLIQRLRNQASVNLPERVVSVVGNIKHPGAYPLTKGMKVSDLLQATIDVLPETDEQYALLRREYGSERRIEVEMVSLSDIFSNINGVSDVLLQPRDRLIVFNLNEGRGERIKPLVQRLRSQATVNSPEKIVTIKGNVKHPGVYPLTKEMRLSQLIMATRDVLPETDYEYGIIQRERGLNRNIEVVNFNLLEVLNEPGGVADPLLNSRDQVFIFGEEKQRELLLSEVNQKLVRQVSYGELAQVVKVGGKVRFAGTYPLTEGMQISELIAAAGGLKESAYVSKAEITNYQIVDGEYRETGHSIVNLDGVLKGSDEADVKLKPYDHLSIKEMPNWRDSRTVEISGEVNFPGTYVVKEGEMLSAVLQRAGGLTEQADPITAVFLRESVRQREWNNLASLRDQLKKDLAAISLEKANISTTGEEGMALSAVNGLVAQLETVEPVGRLVINLENLLLGNKESDIQLDNQDRFYVGRSKQEVSVFGEVFHATSHFYQSGMSLGDYVDMSGGVTKRADYGRIYIVRVNGQVEKANRGWFSVNSNIMPGDSIIVPLDVDYLSSLRMWSSVSQIVYQLGVAAAAWNAIGLL